MKTITTTAAANLAQKYHDAMTMVRDVDALRLPAGTSPRQALEGYLQACKVCGVRLHNDTWETEAERVVNLLTQRRRISWSEALRVATDMIEKRQRVTPC